jgi:hypothetical protein
MAETVLADVIIPEIFYPYVREQSIYKNALFQAGILVPSTQIVDFLGGGSKTFNVPYWKALTGDADVPSETVADTVNALTTDKMIAVRQIRHKAWGANALSAQLSGADPSGAIAAMVSDFWATYFQNNLIHCLNGILADNVISNSGDLVLDIAADTAAGVSSATKISAAKTIEAIMKMGDQFADLKAIAVHSVVYTTMLQNDLIDFVQDSKTGTQMPYYIGLRVIVDDGMTVETVADTVHYTSILFKGGAIGFGENPGKIKPIETFRDPSKGSGIDILYTRRQFAFAPLGFAWNKASNAAVTPSHADLYAATSWGRVYDKKNVGVVFIISNG